MATDAGCHAQADAACGHAAAAACLLASSQPPDPSAAAAAPVLSHAEQQEVQAADTATGAPQAAGPVQACPEVEPNKSTALCGKRQRAELSLYEELLLEHTKSKLRQRRGSKQEAVPPAAPHAQPKSRKDELKQPKRGRGVQAKQGKPQQQAKHSKPPQQAKQRKLQQQANPLSDSEAEGLQQQQQQQQQGEPSLLDVLWREHTLSKLRHNRAPAPHAAPAAAKEQRPQEWSTTSAAESSDDPDEDVDTTDSDMYTTASRRKPRQRPQQKQQLQTQQLQQQQQGQPLLLDVLWREHTMSKLRRTRGAVQSGHELDAAALQPAQGASALSAEASTSGVDWASNSTAACKQKVVKRQAQHIRQKQPQVQQAGGPRASGQGQQQEQGQQVTVEGSLLDELWRAHMLGKLRRKRAPPQHSADPEQPGQATSAATDTSTTTEASSYDTFDDSGTADSDTSAPTSPRQTQHKRLKQPRAQRQQQQQRQQKQQTSLLRQQQDQQQPEQAQVQHDCPPGALQQTQQPCQAEPTLYEVMWREHMLSKLRRHKSGLKETKPKAKRAPDGRKRSADCPAWSKQGLEAAVGQGAAMLGLRGVVPVGGRTGSRLGWSACAGAGEQQGAPAAELQEMQTGTQQDGQQQQQEEEALQQNQPENQTLQEQQEQQLQQKEAEVQPFQQTEQQVEQQHPRTQLLPACQQQPGVGVLVLLHESGWPNAAVWEHYEALHGGRLVVKVHLKAGVQVAEGLEGWAAIQCRRLRTAVKAEWGDLSLTGGWLVVGQLAAGRPAMLIFTQCSSSPARGW